jgi:hypothetical protein
MNTLTRTADWLERQELESLYEHCPEASRRALGLEVIDTETALISLSTREPSILLNRTLGLGAMARVGASELLDIMSEYRARGIDNYLLQLDRDGVDCGDDDLRALGLEKGRGWRRFQRGTEPAPNAKTDLLVRAIEPQSHYEVSAFGRVVTQSFGLAPGVAPMFTGAAFASAWRYYGSFEGAPLAGTGALFIAREPATGTLCGWFDMGATSPEFRRRGGQFAVMAARVQAGLDAGCTWLFTETGEAVPGDDQHSYKNMLRCGFVEASLKENWRPKRS